jgi:glycosyltransferase involved in cell wall biosynthesis
VTDRRVTIGVPVYNGADYLGEALDALLAQTHEDLTILISDNASSDDTEEIGRSYAAADERVSYHRNRTNLGATGNWDRLRQLADTPYFKWAAHDDLHEPTFVESCLELLEQDPRCVLAYTAAVVIDAESRLVAASVAEGIDGTNINDVARFRDFLLHEIWCIPVFGVMRTEAVKALPPTGRYYGSDKAVLAELILAGTFLKVDAPLFRRRFHAANSSQHQGRAARVFQAGGGGGLAVPQPVRMFGGYVSAISRSRLSIIDKALAFGAVVSMFTDRETSEWREEHRVRLNQVGSQPAVEPKSAAA